MLESQHRQIIEFLQPLLTIVQCEDKQGRALYWRPVSSPLHKLGAVSTPCIVFTSAWQPTEQVYLALLAINYHRALSAGEYGVSAEQLAGCLAIPVEQVQSRLEELASKGLAQKHSTLYAIQLESKEAINKGKEFVYKSILGDDFSTWLYPLR